MAKLILMRHGASEWNDKNLFTGWVDIPLSKQGVAEAIAGGQKIRNEPIDVIFTSSLIRAIMTAMLAMNEHASKKVPVILHPEEEKFHEWSRIWGEDAQKEVIPTIPAWELNERMYGQLQGMNKDETRKKFGAEQVQVWRRSYDVRPPEGESLEMTAHRTLPYFEREVIPWLEKNKNVYISAHGNSLRSIIMEIEKLSPEEVVALEIATGDPIIYETIQGKFHVSRPLSRQ